MVRQACAYVGRHRPRPHQARRARRLRRDQGLHAYKLDGKTINHFPAGITDQAAVEPIYETVKGWSGSTRGARSWAHLPAKR
jgi:adenylosuccinate synthase